MSPSVPISDPDPQPMSTAEPDSSWRGPKAKRAGRITAAIVGVLVTLIASGTGFLFAGLACLGEQENNTPRCHLHNRTTFLVWVSVMSFPVLAGLIGRLAVKRERVLYVVIGASALAIVGFLVNLLAWLIE
jgi:hypothetical protein